MIERGERHRRADAQALGARRRQHAQHVHRGADAEGREVMLGQPHRVEAGAVHDFDALERAGIDVFQRAAAAGPAEELQDSELHSPLIPAALTMGHHFSISAFCQAPSACGVSWSTGGMSCPSAASFSLVPGSASDFTTAAFNLAMMSGDVPLGAHSPCPTETCRPGRPTSSTVGTSGAEAIRSLAVTANALMVPA